MNYIRKNIHVVIAIIFSVWAMILRVLKLNGRSLWNDEIYQLSLTRGPFKNIFAHGNYGDMTCYPGDYLLTYPFVTLFHESKWGNIIPHIFFTVLGFYLLFKICQRYYRCKITFIIPFMIMCFNQYSIFHAFELRPYAVLPTLILLSFYLADLLTDYRFNQRSWNMWGVAVLYVWMMNFHAFGIVIVSLPLFYMMLRKKELRVWNEKNKYLLKYLSLIYIIGGILWCWYASGSRAIGTNFYVFEYIPSPLDGFGKFFNYVFFYYLIGHKPFYFLLGGWIFYIIVPFKNKSQYMLFFLSMIVLPVTMILTADLVNGYWFLRRQFIYLVPMLAFLLGWLWDSALSFYIEDTNRFQSWRAKVGVVLMGVCTIAGVIGMVT